MIRNAILTTAVIAALAMAIAPRAVAGPTPAIAFFMPMGVDPFDLNFTFSGESFIVSGNQLEGGLEMTVPDGGPLKLDEFTFESLDPRTSGPLDFSVGNDGFPFVKWNKTALSPNEEEFSAAPGSALVGEEFDSAFLFAGFSLIPPVDVPPDFGDAQFRINGFAPASVPEPGHTVLLAASCLSLGTLRLRRVVASRRASK